MNLIEPQMRLMDSVDTKRIWKYHRRGFGSILFPFCGLSHEGADCKISDHDEKILHFFSDTARWPKAV